MNKIKNQLHMTKITVQNTEVNVIKVDGEDYICLTDMLRAKDQRRRFLHNRLAT